MRDRPVSQLMFKLKNNNNKKKMGEGGRGFENFLKARTILFFSLSPIYLPIHLKLPLFF